MAVEKKWIIEKLEIVKSNNDMKVVTHAHWRCSGTDGTFTGTVFKMIDLGEPNFDQFINYKDLTEEQVINWVHKKMTPEIVEYWETLVDIQIEKQHRPKEIEHKLPWEK